MSELPTPKIVTTPEELQDLVAILANEKRIAIDTESNSLFAYRERVCLLQISTSDQDWLVDPLAVPDLKPLAPIMANPEIEKVFHAAEYDILCLKRDYDFSFTNLFDTMFAARILGFKEVGLGALLGMYFGTQVDKRYQRANWALRPLPPEQLRYAQQDTYYLLALRDILWKQLEEGNHLREASEIFTTLANVQPSEHTFDPNGFWRIHSAREFSLEQLALLREIYLLREELAQQKDRPTFKIMAPETMTAIVAANPRSLRELARVPGITRFQVQRYGKKILQALEKGRVAELPERPARRPRPDQATVDRFNLLCEWRKLKAVERGVESDIILSKETLWLLAKTLPKDLAELATIPGMGSWKQERYGAELLTLLNPTDSD